MKSFLSFSKIFLIASLVAIVSACGGGGGGGGDSLQSAGGSNHYSSQMAIDWTPYQNASETSTLDLTGHVDINFYKFLGYAGKTYTITLSGFAENLDVWVYHDCVIFGTPGLCDDSGSYSNKGGIEPESLVFNPTKSMVYYISVNGQNDSPNNSVRYTLSLSSTNGDVIAPSSYAGIYRGTYTGNPGGTFTVTVDSTGKMTGSTYNGITITTANVSSNGSVTTTSGAASDGTQFSGTISTGGTFSGTWIYPPTGESGTFTSSRG